MRRRAASSAPAGRRRSRSPPSGRCRRSGGCWRSPARCGWRASKSSRPTSSAGAARHRDEVDDRVGRAAHRHRDRDRVVERRAGQDRAPASGPPTPSRRCAGRTRPPCARWPASAAGIDEAPGSVMPSASAMRGHGAGGAHRHAGAVAARDAALDRRATRASLIVPARRSSQYFQASEPEPSILPCQLPRSIGPAGMKIAGMAGAGRAHQQRRAWSCRSRPSAPRRRSDGVRSSSSASIARKLR